MTHTLHREHTTRNGMRIYMCDSHKTVMISHTNTQAQAQGLLLLLL